jgi:hypothetical protein
MASTLFNADDHDETALPCASKLVFDTRRQAEAAATVAQHQHGSRLRVYRCRYCGLWHLSSDY